MGLRMWCPPEEAQTKTATKADPSASARSTIRRQTTVRPSPRSSRHRSNAVPPGLDRRYLLDIIRRDRENAISMSTDRDELDEALADLERHEASNRRRLDSGRALLRDALSYEPGQRMRQIRESALRYEVPPPVPTMPNTQDDSNHEPTSRLGHRRIPAIEARWTPPPQYMPTPPYTSTDTADQSPADSIPLYAHLPPLLTGPGATPLLTPRFAPAYRQDDSAFTQRNNDNSRRARQSHLTSLREAYADGHPPLRRNRHRTPYNALDDRGLPVLVDHADGLGDRRRSFSPEENTWETLLTTITPDDRLPSAESSFTSASASASSLSSNSASSSATLLTAPSSSSGTLNAVSNICDDPTDSDCSETDDEFVTVAHHQFLDDLPPPDPRRYSANIHATGRRMSREINDQFERLRRTADEELANQRMQTMAERAAVRDPSPDTWWGTAGLSRSTSGRVDRTERERL